MLDPARLQHALALHRASYQLMKWIGDGVDRALTFDHAHGDRSLPGAASEWLERNFLHLPPQCRPEREHVAEFANLVASYLETSFELTEQPRRGLQSYAGHAPCLCPLCSSMTDLSRLTTRRLTRGDKDDARALLRAQLQRAAGAELDPERADAVIADPELREPVALVAWAHELLRRLDGHFTGPAVLALWRMFAWTPTGAPRKGFEVTLEGILAAEARIAAEVTRAR